MYNYDWDAETGGYVLRTEQGKFVAYELRPVFAEELCLLGFDKHFEFDHIEQRPYMWALHNGYYYRGERVAQINYARYGFEPECSFLVPSQRLEPIDIKAMVEKNAPLMQSLLTNTRARIKEMYDTYHDKCDVIYIGFSGGKDSMVMLDICHEVLPLDCPVVFSDTDMELPDTYDVWEKVKNNYEGRAFIAARANRSALENWQLIGPPSRTIRWCCSVHKSTPALLALKQHIGKNAIKALAFVGIRGEESISRSNYNGDIGDGVKNSSQINAMPLREFGAHELFLYFFEHELIQHRAYRYGLPRVGCVLCPEASEKYTWLIDKIYADKKLIEPYHNIIASSYSKTFASEEDKADFFASAGWQARKNGMVLKKPLVRSVEKFSNGQLEWCVNSDYLDNLRQWCKTIGNHESNSDVDVFLLKSNNIKWSASGKIELLQNNGKLSVVCNYDKVSNVHYLASSLRTIIQKSMACVGCQACEAECPTGALEFKDKQVIIDEVKCVHCLRCHNVDYGCWRYKSLVAVDSNSVSLKSISKYANFGLRKDWLSVYLEEGDNFHETTQLGKLMIPAARAWFKQSGLMDDSNNATKLLDVAYKFGVDDGPLWDMMWFGLVNYAILIRWFVCSTLIDQVYPINELKECMVAVDPSANSKSGLSSLSDTFRKSPFGIGDYPMVSFNLKGKSIEDIKRIAHPINNLTLLYCYYMMAQITGNVAFTVSDMMGSEFDSKYISPIVAFGLQPDDVQAQSRGLASRYPSFISCTFTHDLDEIKLNIKSENNPDGKTLDDVIELILKEN